MTDIDEAEVRAIAERLRTPQETLGERYWTDDGVQALQEDLRRALGGYGAWGPDKPPMHQRSRRAAHLERDVARLLWPY
jgi:hypothetical protein